MLAPDSCLTDTRRYSVSPGTPNFQAMDTNGDGQLTMADDMYTPYYPGDEYVDWVGMSIYNFGTGQTSSTNSIAPAYKLAHTVSQIQLVRLQRTTLWKSGILVDNAGKDAHLCPLVTLTPCLIHFLYSLDQRI